ncbi:MAG TPA: hypothetical protein VFF49_00860 [Thermodesulfobacteriota bacterium]|nr:hypothetical protein [Thermodesulfobacteriota bacterium]
MDRLFKIGLLILGAVFLLLYSINSQKGRYQIGAQQRDIIILDTSQGIFYGFNDETKGWMVIDPKTGEISAAKEAKK